MSDFDQNALIRHIRGATVMHQSPFSSIEVPTVEDALSIEQCKKWVVPFYRVSFQSVDKEFNEALRNIYSEITPGVVELLLRDYNWRPRLTGAFFAAVKQFVALEDQIGRLLLRSDVCFAGTLYCVALAEFNTPKGIDYLTRYLEYYLTRSDLDYDQGAAMGAVAYLDAKNGTKYFDKFLPKWNAYVHPKSWKPEVAHAVAGFAGEMRAVHECRTLAQMKE